MARQKKLFVIRKFIMARDVKEAMKLDRATPAEEIWIDDDWKKAHVETPSEQQLGFNKDGQ